MTKFVTEMLDEINNDPSKIVNYKESNALKLVFEYAFNPANKFVLPDGDPPYKEDAAPLGMSPANLLMELKRFYVFCRADLNDVRRETLFVQLLENTHPSEAKVLLAIKDQTLHKMYKKITHKLVYEAGLVTVAPEVKQPKKSKVLVGADL
jgi:hypothetical protein